MSRKALSHAIKMSPLREAVAFNLRPDAEVCADIAERLGLQGLKKLTFKGEVRPEGDRDARLKAHLGASVTQPCGVTLKPVTTRLEEDVTRLYLAHMPDTPDTEEAEMPTDVEVDPLPQTLDVAQVMEEALSLALPMFPRAPDAEPGDISVTEPGKAPMTDDDAKPFAALSELREKLSRGDD